MLIVIVSDCKPPNSLKQHVKVVLRVNETSITIRKCSTFADLKLHVHEQR